MGQRLEGTTTHCFILAFDFGGTKIAVATADLNGEVLVRKEARTKDFSSGRDVLNQAILMGQELVADYLGRISEASLVGVGVSTMGITKRTGVLMAPNVPGWAELRIQEAMESAFPGTPVVIDNDVKAAALAELKRGALQGADVGLYVNLGTGIAMTHTLNGSVVHGHNGAAGEIAYNLRHPHEPLGVSNNVAPLEEFVGGRNIASRMQRYFGAEISAKDLFQMSVTDARAHALTDEIGRELAYHVTNAIISWDPEVVVFGGGMVRSWEILSPYVDSYVKKFAPFPPKLVVAHYLSDASLHGAIELALQPFV